MSAVYSTNRSAVAAYEALVNLAPGLSTLFVRPYKIPPQYEQRVAAAKSATGTLTRARQLRVDVGLPFWDAVVLDILSRGHMEDWLVDGLLFHQEPVGAPLAISRKEIQTEGILKAVERAGVPYPWAVLSEVAYDHGGRKHIPMLDFRCEISPSNLRSVENIATRLMDSPWALIESERSYHLIGAQLLSFEGLAAFYGRALLLGPIVDRHYIAHQLVNGHAALRVTVAPGRRGLTTRLATFPCWAWGRDVEQPLGDRRESGAADR